MELSGNEKDQALESLAQKLTELKGTDSWQRDGYVEKQGWATMPGDEKPVRNVADACAKLLLASK